MNWQVDLDVVYGSSQHNPALLKTMTKSLFESPNSRGRSILAPCDGFSGIQYHH